MLVREQELRKDVESGTGLGIPDGVLINGIGPFRFDEGIIKGGNPFLTVNVEQGIFLGCLCEIFIWFLYSSVIASF